MALTLDQGIVFATLAGALLMFVTGWLRYDMVALAALLILALTHVIPASKIFSGFHDDAVISVAAVLVMSGGLRACGVVEVLAERIGALGERLGDSARIALLGGVASILSAFINDVGTLALFMPVATKLARKHDSPPGRILMPLAAATLLGGMLTLIGAPVNLIVSAYRARIAGSGFGMFAYTPVGIILAVAGLAFVSLLGWRLLPKRDGGSATGDAFRIDEYMTEARVPEEAALIGKTIRDLEATADGKIGVLALLRGGVREVAPSGFQTLHAGDILILRGDHESLEAAIAHAGLRLEAQAQAELAADGKPTPLAESDMMEAVVVPGSTILGRTALGLDLRERYAVNLLAVARSGGPLRARLRSVRFEVGDVLLVQGAAAALRQSCADLGLLPLAEREVRLGHPRRAMLALGVFALALAAATFNLFSVPVCLLSGAVAMILLQLLPLDAAYAALEGPVLVLIAGMIVVAGALQSTGASRVLAAPLLALGHHLPPTGAVAMIFVVAMLISVSTNYVATAVLMAPIAHSVSHGLGLALDPFLMAVAYGSVAAFLTPIGHPSNTLVMAPGNYRFRDYLFMGLPLSLLTAVLAALFIPMFWPLRG